MKTSEEAVRIRLQGQTLWLMPQKAVFWQEKNLLLIADLHLGKAGHFRRLGIPVPGQVNRTNLDILSNLVRKTSTRHLIVLGDLFHSSVNKEWEQFRRWRLAHPYLQLSLIKGNHDILPVGHYISANIQLHKQWLHPPFMLVHDHQKIAEDHNKNSYILSGHIHPAVKLIDHVKQTIKLPCFYFRKNHGILPAFGEFTGTHVIHPRSDDRIYAIANETVISLTNQDEFQ